MPAESWQGNVSECVVHLDVLYANGKLVYKPDASDPPDSDAIENNTAGVVRLREVMPKLNGRWSTFVKAIYTLKHIVGTGSAASKLAIAEEQAHVVRNCLRHIRRE